MDGVDPTGDGPISGVGQSNAATTSLGRAQVLSEARASAASQQCAQAQFLAYVSSEGEFLHSEYQAEQWAISNDAPGAIQLAEKYGNDAGVFATNVSSSSITLGMRPPQRTASTLPLEIRSRQHRPWSPHILPLLRLEIALKEL